MFIFKIKNSATNNFYSKKKSENAREKSKKIFFCEFRPDFINFSKNYIKIS